MLDTLIYLQTSKVETSFISGDDLKGVHSRKPICSQSKYVHFLAFIAFCLQSTAFAGGSHFETSFYFCSTHLFATSSAVVFLISKSVFETCK